jgi:hypothetical protein
MAWFKRFCDPITLPNGRELLTLRDAAEYITALPKAEQDAAQLASCNGNSDIGRRAQQAGNAGRLAVLKALNRHSPNAPSEPRRKPAKMFRIVR